MILIFVMSNQPANESSQLSGGIVSKLIAAFFNEFDDLSMGEQAKIIDTATVIVRKTAHFLEYFVLGLLASFNLLTYECKRRFKIILPLVFSVLYAVSDEVHQYFVPGRACRFGDMCIDTMGIAVAIVLVLLCEYFYNRKKTGEFYAKKRID